VSRLSFRVRLFIALVVASTVPVIIVGGFGAALVTGLPGAAADSAAVEAVGFTHKTMMTELQRVPLTPGAVRAVQRHDTTVSQLLVDNTRLTVARAKWPHSAAWALGFATLAMVIVVVVAGRLLAAQYAAPLTEIADWTRRIERHEALPATTDNSVAPEVATLRQSLRELQRGLEQARAAELEAERLRAFGEVARRVAHEMKNPLTPIRLAVRQLARRAPPEWQDELEVIAAESARLEAMAREFAELGRLPEGVAAAVDLRELLEDLLRNAVPESMDREFHGEETGTIEGYYDPLRRGFSNVLRNAVEACHGEGRIVVTLRRTPSHVEVILSDNGPGIPVDKRELIFQPYYTEKGDGTGLGLAIVRQTIEQHHGTIAVLDTPGGGATFLVQLPA
jgi:signal transduction histidine kinase